MKLQNSVKISASATEVFALINDVERVVTCVPGATLTGRDGDTYAGSVKVKVGPISAAYNGEIRFVTVDEPGRRLVMEGKGADSKGNGDAQAHVVLEVKEVDGGCELRVDTDLVLSGKIVAFGKGAIVAVSNKIMAQFATNLAELLHSGDTGTRAPASIARPTTTTTTTTDDAGLDVMSMLPPSSRSALLVAGVFVAGMVEGWLISRAFRRS